MKHATLAAMLLFVVSIVWSMPLFAALPSPSAFRSASQSTSKTVPQTGMQVPAGGQTGSALREQMAAGDRENSSRRAREALGHYELALQADGRNYEALWKASGNAIDLGEAETDATKRDALYAKATDYARRAVDVAPDSAEGHFNLSRSLGRLALSLGPRDRVKYGKEVRAEALRTLSIDPKHPGALHVMGVWNAEVMRLNSIARLFAKTLFGGQILGTASWPEAVRYMEQSVAIDPDRTVHRLDLARIYRDLRRKNDARGAYEAAIRAPLVDANDEMYKRAAELELRALK